MRRFVKILLTLICAYAFAGSLWFTVSIMQNQNSWNDIIIIYPANIITLFGCIYLSLLVWDIVKIRFKIIQIILLIIALIIQFQVFVFSFFTRSAGIDYTKENLFVAIPAVLSLFILLVLIIWLIVKKNKRRMQ